jgi:nucleoside-diphosphate-sugar epimerase
MPDTILVTGGAGFIGSHLVDELVKRGHRVRVLDNFSTGKRENLTHSLRVVKVIRGDVRDPLAVRKASRGVKHIFHLAAVSSVPQSVDDPGPTWDANVGGTLNVLEAARLNDVTRFIFISSASVYGAQKKIPFVESMSLSGSSPYATSKLVGEQFCELYGRLYGLETVALRLFSVYGPRQNPRSQYANVIPAFATRLLAGRTPTIYGTGRQTRDFVYVTDVARALRTAAYRKNLAGQVINVGTGRQTSVVGLLKSIQEVLGTCARPQYVPKKPGDDPRTCADVRKARRLLNVNRLTPFQTGLKRTLTWFSTESESR